MEEAPTKPSVAELAGKFKAPIPIPTGTEGSKPVRRRPPRSLQLPIRNQAEEEEEEEKPASPHPAKTKRNSSLIEKLQANLALSPSAILSSPKSPGLRLFSPSSPLFPCAPTPHVTSVTPTSPVAPRSRTQSEEEPPINFETPATPTEGSLLPSINKGRARHSIKRRPPSRRHRKSSEEEVEVATSEDTPLSPLDGPEAKAGEEEEKGDVFEEKEAKTEAVTPKRQRQRQRQAPSESPNAEAKKTSETDSTATDSTKQNATTESPATETEPEGKPQSENTPGSQSEERQGGTEGGEEVTQPGMEEGEEEKVKERRKESVEEKEKSTESSSGANKDQGEPPTETQTETPTSTAARENGRENDELPCKEKEEEKDTGPKEENKSKETTFESSDG